MKNEKQLHWNNSIVPAKGGNYVLYLQLQNGDAVGAELTPLKIMAVQEWEIFTGVVVDNINSVPPRIRGWIKPLVGDPEWDDDDLHYPYTKQFFSNEHVYALCSGIKDIIDITVFQRGTYQLLDSDQYSKNPILTFREFKELAIKKIEDVRKLERQRADQREAEMREADKRAVELVLEKSVQSFGCIITEADRDAKKIEWSKAALELANKQLSENIKNCDKEQARLKEKALLHEKLTTQLENGGVPDALLDGSGIFDNYLNQLIKEKIDYDLPY